MSDEKVAVSIPVEIVSDKRNRLLLPDAIRINLIERAEAAIGQAIEFAKEDLLAMDDEIFEEQARRGFDRDYNLNEYGRYLDALLAMIEKIRLRT